MSNDSAPVRGHRERAFPAAGGQTQEADPTIAFRRAGEDAA